MTLTCEQISILRLMRSSGIGLQTFWSLIRKFHSPLSIVENWLDIQPQIKRKVQLISEKNIMIEIEKALRFGAQFLFYTDSFYPSLLNEAPDKPPMLTFKGNASLLDQNIIALVGARNASSHGCRLTYLMAKELGGYKWKIISGLARGIDTAAHQGSVSRGTIAVLGNGIRTVYPEENKKLYEEISEKGILLSEFSFDAEPHVGNFPKRNRLIAALARGVVVVEAAYQSGSLLTAQYALEMGREVFSVPGSPMDPRCRGSNRLIKQGATLVESAQDVLEVLDQTRWLYCQKQSMGKQKKITKNMSNKEVSILDHLSAVPLSVDELVEVTQVPMHQLSSILTDLELSGQVRKHPGNKVSLALPG